MEKKISLTFFLIVEIFFIVLQFQRVIYVWQWVTYLGVLSGLKTRYLMSR